eukprot:3469314-Pyramimonas_sp.AAC.1
MPLAMGGLRNGLGTRVGTAQISKSLRVLGGIQKASCSARISLLFRTSRDMSQAPEDSDHRRWIEARVRVDGR